jgi:hypothetical protein
MTVVDQSVGVREPGPASEVLVEVVFDCTIFCISAQSVAGSVGIQGRQDAMLE